MPISVRSLWLPALVAVALGCSSEEKSSSNIDDELAGLMNTANVTPLVLPPQPTASMFTLGQALMFDKELSGNRNIACSTCHHPLQHSSDGIALSIGEGASGLGPARTGGGAIIPRHAPDLFNRGAALWAQLFWDGRVAQAQAGGFTTPAGAAFPAGVTTVLGAQAIFPITVRDEMRGNTGDPGNELADFADDDFAGIWEAILDRLRAIPKYDTLFTAAFGISVDAAGIQHVGNAIAAFQSGAFTRADTPFDAYVAGDLTALDPQQKRGARLFFGKASCGKCHLGPLLSDQKFHNIASPQLGPGRGPGGVFGLDYGRENVTGLPADRFSFRTPPLRNVALTAPYFHDGAFATLEAAVRHYISVTRSLQTYDASQLPANLQGTVRTGAPVWNQILATLDPIVSDTLVLSDGEVTDIVAFLQSLTDPAALDMAALVPASVPSGLPVVD